MELHISLEHLLRQTFGFTAFRPGQREIIEAILRGRDVLGILPTGSGKSLCYQLPAVASSAVTLVISPLVALMHDQVSALQQRGIPSTAITSTLGSEEIAYRLRSAQLNHVRLLYIAPERLESTGFLEHLRRINVERIVVDEAHCISQWGHDFRPAYMRIRNLVHVIGRKQIVALTATATPRVQHDILAQLGMRDPYVHIENFDRPNLGFCVEECPPSKGYQQKAARVADAVERCRGAAIIYVGTRRATEIISAHLRSFGINARSYHAGMPDAMRLNVQEWFMADSTPVLVATVAFGMGIDKPDVRLVAHCDLPLSIENYYQEAGRAGRDGRDATCLLLYSHGDERLQRRLIESQFPPRRLVEETYNLIAERLRVAVGLQSSAVLRDDPATLARALSCTVNQLENVIDFLERQQLLSRRRGNRSLQVRIATSRQRWLEYCSTAPADRAAALNALLRSLGPSAYDDAVELSLDDLEQRHAVSVDELYRALRAAELARIIEVYPGSDGDGLRLVGERYSRQRLPIEWHQIDERRAAAVEKAMAMLDYARSAQCKRAIILAYFGQPAPDVCGKCSSCRRPARVQSVFPVHKRSAYEEFIRRVLVSIIADYDGLLTVPLATAIANGQSNDQIVALGAHRSEYFGQLVGVSPTILRTRFDELILDGYLELKRPTNRLRITDAGYTLIGRTRARTDLSKPSTPEQLLDSTVQKSIELARQGYSPAQIAQMRDLSLTTIVSHLVQALSVGVDLPRATLIDKRLYQETCAFISQRPNALLRDLQAYIGGMYDVALLRLALAFARRECSAS